MTCHGGGGKATRGRGPSNFRARIISRNQFLTGGRGRPWSLCTTLPDGAEVGIEEEEEEEGVEGVRPCDFPAAASPSFLSGGGGGGDDIIVVVVSVCLNTLKQRDRVRGGVRHCREIEGNLLSGAEIKDDNGDGTDGGCDGQRSRTTLQQHLRSVCELA